MQLQKRKKDDTVHTLESLQADKENILGQIKKLHDIIETEEEMGRGMGSHDLLNSTCDDFTLYVVAANAPVDDFMGVVLVPVDRARIAMLRGQIREHEAQLAKVHKLISIAQPAFSIGSLDVAVTVNKPEPKAVVSAPQQQVAVVPSAPAQSAPAPEPVHPQSSPSKETNVITPAPTPAEQPKAAVPKPAQPAIVNAPHDDESASSGSDLEEELEPNDTGAPKRAPLVGGLFDPKVCVMPNYH